MSRTITTRHILTPDCRDYEKAHELQYSFTLIAAVSLNGVIGIDNKIPWRIPEDMQYFLSKTLNNPVIMGRLTYWSLPKRGLPGRLSTVVSRDTSPFDVLTNGPTAEEGGAADIIAYDIDSAIRNIDAFIADQIRRNLRGIECLDPSIYLGREYVENWSDKGVAAYLAHLKGKPVPIEIFGIGGTGIYSALLPHASKVYITRVKDVVEGDTVFPVEMKDCPDWKLVSETPELLSTGKEARRFTFEVWTR